MGKIMINISHSKDDVERATLGFVVANAGLTAGQESTVLLTLDGVWAATRGFADGVQADGYAPLDEIITNFVKNGGKIWVCGACSKPRNITAEQLIEGTVFVGAAAVVEAMVTGTPTMSF
jgi:predicted peroxiredoxin